MKDHIDDIIGLVALFILSAGINENFGFGWALIAFGSLLFATVLLVIILSKPKLKPKI